MESIKLCEIAQLGRDYSFKLVEKKFENFKALESTKLGGDGSFKAVI